MGTEKISTYLTGRYAHGQLLYLQVIVMAEETKQLLTRGPTVTVHPSFKCQLVSKILGDRRLTFVSGHTTFRKESSQFFFIVKGSLVLCSTTLLHKCNTIKFCLKHSWFCLLHVSRWLQKYRKQEQYPVVLFPKNDY